jgi:hypothetical protein
MLRTILASTILVTLTASAAVAVGAATDYGDGVAITEPTPIDRLLTEPETFVGKTVRVDGTVLDVCPAKGCWMELGSEAGKIRIKVEDDVIVFPADAKGRPAAAEGVLEAIEMKREQYTEWLRHLAEERGEAFDPATVGAGPFRVYQIQATGARIGEGDPETEAVHDSID